MSKSLDRRNHANAEKLLKHRLAKLTNRLLRMNAEQYALGDVIIARSSGHAERQAMGLGLAPDQLDWRLIELAFFIVESLDRDFEAEFAEVQREELARIFGGHAPVGTC